MVDYNCIYKQIKFKLKHQTQWNLMGHSTITPPPVLSHTNILPPPLSHCAFIPSRKNSVQI